MLRKQIVQKHVNYHDISHILGHAWIVYVPSLVKTMLFLGCLYVLFLFLNTYGLFTQGVSYVFAFLGLFVYAKGMVDFLNHYLDCMVLTSHGIVVFKREGLLEYQTDTFSWDRIETISHTKDSLWDKLLYKGDIVVTLEHGVNYGFDNIAYPLKNANIILEEKQRHTSDVFDDDEVDDDKFTLLVETLGEVIQDYIGKKPDPSVLRDSFDPDRRY